MSAKQHSGHNPWLGLPLNHSLRAQLRRAKQPLINQEATTGTRVPGLVCEQEGRGRGL